MDGKLDQVETWTCQDVEKWLRSNGFEDYATLLAYTHRIDGKVLLSLSESDLRNPPLKLGCLGDIKRLAWCIQSLQSLDSHSSEAANTDSHSDKVTAFVATLSYSQTQKPESAPDTSTGDSPKHNSNSPEIPCRTIDIPSEIWKTVLSFVYVFGVFMLTAFVMVLVHDRVPEMEKYPPLPDIVLDNLPYIPWAFEACELSGLLLGLMWLTLLVFHRHRFVLMRRMFSLMGTIFLLRCVTMLITSLSVPGKHLQCSGKRYGDWYSRGMRTWEIWRGLGMSLQGVQSCGDYMFSGHTSIITLLNFFITEYTPKKYHYVHIMSWLFNVFGIFFLLAAHEHYSIDVFVAFYLSSRLFMYYHTLANNRALLAPDAQRTRIWFPLFAYFESKCDGRLPNEFEHPLDLLTGCLRACCILSPSPVADIYSHTRSNKYETEGVSNVRLNEEADKISDVLHRKQGHKHVKKSLSRNQDDSRQIL